MWLRLCLKFDIWAQKGSNGHSLTLFDCHFRGFLPSSKPEYSTCSHNIWGEYFFHAYLSQITKINVLPPLCKDCWANQVPPWWHYQSFPMKFQNALMTNAPIPTNSVPLQHSTNQWALHPCSWYYQMSTAISNWVLLILLGFLTSEANYKQNC